MSSNSKNNEQYQTIRIFGIPIANIEPMAIGSVIDHCISHEQPSQIVFLSWWELIHAICNWDRKVITKNVSIVVPTSPLIAFGIFLLHGKRIHYHTEFDFVIKVLSRIEAQGKSLYLLGMEMEHIQTVEQNIKNTFPNLMIVGRYSCYFSSIQEQKIITAIRKANATLVLAGNGVPGKDMWLYRAKHKIKPSIMIWSGTTMSVLAGRTRKMPNEKVQRAIYITRQIIRKPWRIYRFFVFVFYFLALLYMRIFRK